MKIVKEPAVRIEHDNLDYGWIVGNGFKCTLEQIIEAALQPDTELAEQYREFLRILAPQLNVSVTLEKDGSADSGGCWFAAEIWHVRGPAKSNRVGCRPLASDVRRGPSIKGWKPTDKQRAEHTEIVLQKCREIGLVD